MLNLRVCLALLLGVCLLAPIRAQQPPYRILVTNDDGVHAPGLAAVAQILQAIGEVIVVAPSDAQSGKGHSIVMGEPVWREDVTLANGLYAIGLTATPASTVNVALSNIVTPTPDLLVSGLNRGYNLGWSAYLSGTVGAAREGAMHGVPSIAVSMAEIARPAELVFAAEEVLGVARRVKQYGLPLNAFLNVNIPAVPQDGYRGYQITTQAMSRGGVERFDEARHPSGRTIFWSVYREGIDAPRGTDIWAVENGYVSVTPMTLGEGDPSQREALQSIFQ